MNEIDVDDVGDLAVYQSILDTLTGPRVVWRDGEASVDLSAFDRPFVPAVRRPPVAVLTRRR